MTVTLAWQVGYVIFIQGLLLLILAARTLTMEKTKQTVPWVWFAGATATLGLERWLGLLTGPAPALVRVLLLAASTALLAHFAQAGIRGGARLWIGPLSGSLVLAGLALGPVGRAVAVTVGLAAGLWASAALWRAARSGLPGKGGLFLRGGAIALAVSSLVTAAALPAPPSLSGIPPVLTALAVQRITAWQTIPVAFLTLFLYGYATGGRTTRFALATGAALVVILGLGMGAAYYAGLGALNSLQGQGSKQVDSLAGLVDHTLGEVDRTAASLARSTVLERALETPGTPAVQAADQALAEYRRTFRVSVCYLMNTRGLTVASSNFAAPDSFVGHNYGFRPYFQEAMAGQSGSYFAMGVTSFERGYYAAAPVRDAAGRVIGVAVVKKNLDDLETAWTPYRHSYLIDADGVIFLSGQDGLRFETLWPLDQATLTRLQNARQFGPGPYTASLGFPVQVANNTLVVSGGRSYLVNRELVGRGGWSVVVLKSAAPVGEERLLAGLTTMLVALAATVLLLSFEAAAVRKEDAACSAANYHTVFNAVNDGVLVIDPQTDAILDANRTAEEMFGRTADELRRITMHDLDGGNPGVSPENIRDTHRRAAQGQPLMFEWQARAGDGRSFWTEINLKPACLGGETRLLAVVRDITGRKNVEEALQASEATYRTIFEKSGLALAIIEENATVSLASPAFAALAGYGREEIEGRKAWFEFIHPEDLPKVKQYARLRRTFPQGTPSSFELRAVDRQGRQKTLLTTVTFIPGTLRTVAAMADITTRKAMEERLRYLSLHDVLTNLYNRSFFEKHIRRRTRYGTESTGIIVCDMDGLKLVNDTLGHRAGDAQLLATANVLRKGLGEQDLIARIGGDEFAVILPRADREAVQAAVERIREAIAAYNQEQPAVPLSLSIGWAAGRPGTAQPDLFREADNNMYREKLFSSQSGRSAIILALVKTLEAREIITAGLVDRQRELADGMGRKLGLPEHRINTLRLLAQFHDIGKIGIPDHITFKPGPLTPKETQEMRRHTQIGHRIAQSTPDLAPIADLIAKHHEWWNGQGYPFGLQGEDIPLLSRIIAIIDAYDAMTSDRPHRKALPPREAVAQLRRCAGTQFDPRLVDVFTDLVADRDGPG